MIYSPYTLFHLYPLPTPQNTTLLSMIMSFLFLFLLLIPSTYPNPTRAVSLLSMSLYLRCYFTFHFVH